MSLRRKLRNLRKRKNYDIGSPPRESRERSFVDIWSERTRAASDRVMAQVLAEYLEPPE